MTTTLEHLTPVGAVPAGGGFHRRLNFFTALISGGLFAFIAWALSHHFLNSDGRGFSDQVTVLASIGLLILSVYGLIATWLAATVI